MDFKIPLFDLNFGPEEEEAVVQTLQSKWISMGPNCQELERNFANLLDVEHAVAVTNCTAALHLALKVLGIGPGDEVIVPSLTFVATVNAVRYVGADPVFADITSLEDLSLDPEDVERKLTDRTKAVMVMHYGGFAAAMDQIMAIARKHDLRVVEDAAHSPGARFGPDYLGAIGDVGCFSFFSNKNITCAEGGMVVTRREDLAGKARLMRAHGMTTLSFERAKGHATSYDVVELGYNYRLDDVRGALVKAQLKKLPGDMAGRKKVRDFYEKELAEIPEIVVPYRGFPHRSSHYIMPVVLRSGGVAKREEVRRKMAKMGIQTSVHYPAVHRFSIYEPFPAELPVTEHVADHELTLPMYPALTTDQVHQVSDALKESL